MSPGLILHPSCTLDHFQSSRPDVLIFALPMNRCKVFTVTTVTAGVRNNVFALGCFFPKIAIWSLETVVAWPVFSLLSPQLCIHIYLLPLQFLLSLFLTAFTDHKSLKVVSRPQLTLTLTLTLTQAYFTHKTDKTSLLVHDSTATECPDDQEIRKIDSEKQIDSQDHLHFC